MLGYNPSPLINIESTQVGLDMLDKLSRMKDGRRIQPLDPSENIKYPHRYLYDGYNLQIGDTYFMIPPEFIMVTSEATSQSIVTLRQENSQKSKSGYHRRTILVDLVFKGADQINGYKVEGPEGSYYMDGLRQLLAQFKCTPFLPIINEMINGMYGIFTVVLQAITIRAEPGFPDMLSAQITLQEVEMFPYIEMPNVAFRYMIDWDLFRFYYQSLLTEDHEYKKLQSVPANKELNRFKLSILKPDVFYGENVNQESLLTMICDSANYTTWINSNESDVVISEFQCGYSNLLTNIQLSDTGTPTVQFMGGMDTIYNIAFETMDYSVVQAIEQCQISNDVLTRDNIKYHSAGFVKLESELIELTGSLFVMIDNVSTNTVPGLAGLYKVQINCVAYDIAQSQRESLNGFLPFSCDRCDNDFIPSHTHPEHAIDQTEEGLINKIKQDNYAEWKLRTTMEVYPDLHLPTYTEVNEFIAKCKSFRASKGLRDLPYSDYPSAPVNMLHGNNPGNGISVPLNDGIANAADIDKSSLEYNIFVDPDFYVFYPASYGSLEKEAKAAGDTYYDTYKPKQRQSYTKVKKYTSYPDEEEPPAATTNTPAAGGSSILGVTGGSTKEKIWNFLKQKGCSDFTAAGILGNLEKESTTFNLTDEENGYGGITPNSGYGLVQWTSPNRQEDLVNWCAQNNLGYDSLDGQLNFMWYEMTNNYAGMMPELLGATSTDQATMTFHDNYEISNDNESQLQERRNYASATYAQFTGKASSAIGAGIGASTKSNYNLTTSEFNSICKTVMAETKGEPAVAERAMAQVIYDRLTHPQKKFGGLSNILSGADQFSKKYPAALNATVETYVKQVFCQGARQWPDAQAWYFLTPADDNGTFQSRDENYERLGDVARHTYWGKNQKGSGVRFTINDKKVGSSSNAIVTETTVNHDAFTITSADKFGVPVMVSTDAIRYADGMMPDGSATPFWANFGKKGLAMDTLNSGENIFNTSFCDEYQYSARGKLVRAFPAYLFCILDDNAAWFDGKKLWTNYYTHRSIVDIQCHETNDMPTATATVVVTNSYHNLDRTQTGLAQYSLKNDANGLLWPSADGYSVIQQGWYKMTGTMPSFGPRLTNKLIELHQIIYNHATLREGSRVHIRMGYGSDPLSLAPVINGTVSDVQLGDQISIVVTSDGCELVQHITSTNEKDTNNGILGLFGLGEEQESSNIIATIMTARQSWFSHLMKDSFEGSKYSIEHFGLYSNQTLTDVSIADVWNGVQEQYDILKNIYKANYKKEHYIYSSLLMDFEQNIVFSQYNMTPWDVFQLCTQQVPEYILKISNHQFDSRLYFGLPFWMEKYRYDYLDNKVYEECKASTQVHLLDSMTNIIDNQIKVTSKFSNTNIKCMYQLGKSVKSTDVIHSDDTIDFSKQKTIILDTPIVQDALGPDALYEFLQYRVGRDSARRVGISNLLYGWEQQYQGQIILLGSPGMKAHDRLLINDTFIKLNGIAFAREVTHSFNTNTGFTTSVTPGMISMCTDENSGMVETCGNYLMILNCFSSYLNTRRQGRVNYEQNLHLFANLETIGNKVMAAEMSNLNNDIAGAKQAVLNIAAGANAGRIVFQMAKHVASYKSFAQIGTTFTTAFGTAMEGVKVLKSVKGISSLYKGIKAGVIAVAGAPTGGIGSIVAAVVFIAIDILLSSVIEWFSNKNVCVLLPLWWDGYPFVSGVNGGEKILLMDNNNTATDENTRADATSKIEDSVFVPETGGTSDSASTYTGADHFGPDAFKCEDGCGTGDVKQELKDKMNKVWDILGVQLNITSGYRCPAVNEAVGGVPDSLHMTGEACDVQADDRSQEFLDKMAAAGQSVGLGTIRYYGSGFVHFQLYERDEITYE